MHRGAGDVRDPYAGRIELRRAERRLFDGGHHAPCSGLGEGTEGEPDAACPRGGELGSITLAEGRRLLGRQPGDRERFSLQRDPVECCPDPSLTLQSWVVVLMDHPVEPSGAKGKLRSIRQAGTREDGSSTSARAGSGARIVVSTTIGCGP